MEAGRRGGGRVVGERRRLGGGRVFGEIEREERKGEERRKEKENEDGRTWFPNGGLDHDPHFNLRRKSPRSDRNLRLGEEIQSFYR